MSHRINLVHSDCMYMDRHAWMAGSRVRKEQSGFKVG
jgi:hypothetical protein